jgi:hypothetical protein
LVAQPDGSVTANDAKAEEKAVLGTDKEVEGVAEKVEETKI